MSPLTNVLLLAVDAGDKFLIKSWAADGTLPTFRSLLDSGMVGDTMSVEGFYEGSTWPSFYTGVTPAHHGFYSLTQLKPGSYEFNRIRPGDFIKRQPFWNYLSRAGRKVAILDIPLSGISKELNGIQMVEWGSHDGVYGFHTWPPQLQEKVLARFGSHPLTTSCDSFGWAQQEFHTFRDLLLQGVQNKAELTNHYLRQGGWDFFAQVFTESHCIGHQCWHLHDPNHPDYDPEIGSKMGDPIRDVYVAIDRAIGQILEQVDKETIILVLVGHRMSHYFGMQFLLPELLCRLGVAIGLSEKNSEEKPFDIISKLEVVLRWGWQHTPKKIKGQMRGLRNYARSWMERRRGQPPSMSFGIDPRKSKCFLLHNGASVSGLRVNLTCREPKGLVQAGAEMDEFCDQLAQDLLKIVNLDTGKPLVRSIKKTAQLYEGEFLGDLPDLLVEWDDDRPLGNAVTRKRGGSVRIASEKIGMIEGVNPYCRTGDHRPEGMFIVRGPGIEPGRLEKTVSIMDFAPTLTKLFNIELPNADGKPIEEVLEARLNIG